MQQKRQAAANAVAAHAGDDGFVERGQCSVTLLRRGVVGVLGVGFDGRRVGEEGVVASAGEYEHAHCRVGGVSAQNLSQFLP